MRPMATTPDATRRPPATSRATSPSLRHARALTQEALGQAATVPRSTVANLESGAGNPSLVVLVKVAQALGVPIDELLASPRAHGAALAGRRGRARAARAAA